MRKYLLLDVKASGHPITGQNILLLPKLLLLLLRSLAPAPEVEALTPPGVAEVFAISIGNVGSGAEAGLGIGTLLGNCPSCSIGVGKIRVSMEILSILTTLIWHFTCVCVHVTP